MSEPGAFAAPSVSYIEDGTYLRDSARAEAVCFSEPWSEKAVEEFLSQPYNHVLVALADGVFAGFITYTRIADEIQIANVAVLPEFRRKGLADGLLCRLAQSAKHNGVSKTTLEVRVSNLPARKRSACGGIFIRLRPRTPSFMTAVRKIMQNKPCENRLRTDSLKG